ncbi:ABC transporter substrate-binding protein [Deferrisoma camini]|uniref:ABC transporter substrate-binding protein n=1 Tax=Deferrisoma camini TaxID=1035120 RepID=UPI00046CDF62|nr:ABC transporter substrate binding protein [Deferrisoma camini]
MRRWWLLCVLLVVGLGGAARAAEVVIVQSARIRPYEEARQAFREALSHRPPLSGTKTLHPHQFTEFVLADQGGREAAARFLESRPVDLILAIGGKALSFADRFRGIPLVYTMVPDPEPRLVFHDRAAGVPFSVPPARWVEVTEKCLPKVRRIGVVFSPGGTGAFVGKASALARLQGMRIVGVEARTAREVRGRLEELRGRIDVLWMLPDLTVLTPQTAEAMLRFSMEERVPVVTFAEKYLRRGAMIALVSDYRRMGEAAAVLAENALSTGGSRAERGEVAQRTRVRVNAEVARKLGTFLDTAWLGGGD